MEHAIKPISKLNIKKKEVTVKPKAKNTQTSISHPPQPKYILKINRDDFINILIKYRIPIARETINEINKYNIFLLEK